MSSATRDSISTRKTISGQAGTSGSGPIPGGTGAGTMTVYNYVAYTLLKMFAAGCNVIPSMNRELRYNGEWINYRIGIATRDSRISQTLEFRDGRANVLKGSSKRNDANIVFRDMDSLIKTLGNDPATLYDLITKNRIILDGDRSALLFMNYMLNKTQAWMNPLKFRLLKVRERRQRQREYGVDDDYVSEALSDKMKKRKQYRMDGTGLRDPGVRFLKDPYLSMYSLDSFPRIRKIHERQRDSVPEISVERPWLMTQWFQQNGFETDSNGEPWHPAIRQALAFRHLLQNRKPVIQEGNLIAGSTGPEEVCVLLFPDTEASLSLWQELDSISRRVMNPHRISKENKKRLKEILPFWRKRNIQTWILQNYGNTTSLQIDGRFAIYYNLKKSTFSHTIPNISHILEVGTSGVKREIRKRLEQQDGLSDKQLKTLKAMEITMDALESYAANLSDEAERLSGEKADPARKEELLEIARICRKVPAQPAETLHEAMTSAWIFLVGVLMENNNISLSPGRLDQVFQPYFERDLEKAEGPEEREALIRRAIELSACLFLRISHHYMAAPDLVNYLYSGTQSDSAITLGGVRPDGEDAVNDMTYILLKVTEMLGNQEPNVNVRYHPGKNSDAFLKRVCEVNYITSGTPSMHNDVAMFKALEGHDFELEDVRDWGATGCVEPCLPGKHASHTNALCMNLIAGLEMALNNGYHPLLDWHLGPETGRPENGDFETFDQFFDAYAEQMRFLIDNHCELNTLCCEAHSQIRPQPFLSSTTEGCIEKALDNTEGGAKYNTSGSFNAGLADVVDSMSAIKKLVFDEGAVSFAELKKAVDENFEGNQPLLETIKKKVPLFGSGSEEAVAMANKLTAMLHQCYAGHRNYRGGKYLTGYWSVSWHSGFGKLSGATPSGRLQGKAFTPGLTPQPHASDSILDNFRDVAKLDPHYMENNIAFNVKFVPNARDSREKTVDTVFSYAKTYFELGGMQLQFNMVDSETLKDAMAHPENYQNLIVRISGYNARFVELSRDLQIELIERSQFNA